MISMQEKRDIWLKAFREHQDLMEGRVKRDIETYRKGDCTLRFTDQNGAPLAGQTVTVCQQTHAFKFGANIFMLDEFENAEDNAKYREFFKEYFNLATVPFYWRGLEPEQGKPRYAKDSPKEYRRPAPDLCMEYCEQNGVAAKLHCLFYERHLPDWLPKDDADAMIALYHKRFKEIADRYTGRMMEMEVINETLREFLWKCQTVLSKRRDVVEFAFDLARRYFPNETLVINETNPLGELASQDYRSRFFMQIEKCLLNGASIDKIGLQHHIMPGPGTKTEEEFEREIRRAVDVNPKNILKGLDLLAEFGLPIEFTEVTVPTFGDTPEDEELQAELLRLLYTVWFSHPSVNTIVYWNTVDGYCYDDGNWNENKCRGGLFRHDLSPKKSAQTLWKLMNEEWHTELTLTTDENGCVQFRGFYGDYTAALGDANVSLSVAVDGDNEFTFTV